MLKSMEDILRTDEQQRWKILKQVNENYYDRISHLPDAILHYILSFLPAEDVVRTTILSKRWRNLRFSLPYLHFRQQSEQGFTDFVNNINNILHHHDSNINEFQLLCACPCDDSNLNGWISRVVRSRVEKLEVVIRSDDEIHSLPSCLFTCNTLVELTLGIRVRFPDSFCFPKIKIMILKDIIVGKSFTDQLLNSPDLEKLSLSLLLDMTSPPNPHPVEGILSFPNLKEAVVDFEVTRRGRILWRSISPDFGVRKFIEKLSNVENLRLSNFCIKMLYFEKQLASHLPVFCNLKNLEVSYGQHEFGRDFEVLFCLLDCCPVLRSLDIRFLDDFRTYGPPAYWMPERRQPCNLPSSLKIVKMMDYNGERDQQMLAMFFFRSTVSKKFIVQVKKSKNHNKELEDLSNLW